MAGDQGLKRKLPLADAADGPVSGRAMTPLQAELLEAGVVPQTDELGVATTSPEPLPGPESERYEGAIPVFQWEIDPTDSSLETGEEHLAHGEWEYDLWWQRHPAEIVYVSIQALHEDPAGGVERQHPMGRNVVVNLVWDERRRGVLAIYGTARDFRPFVEAFRKAYGIQEEAK